MMINVEVEKSHNENNTNLIRRFTKRVQGSGVLPRVRSLRYRTRDVSKYTKKKKTIKLIRRKDEVKQMIKMGKMTDKTRK